MNRILIVEDDETILMGLKDDFEFEGFKVTTTENGREGYALAGGQPFDLIILDILLPELTGIEICRKLREDGINTPILMLTAARTEELDKVIGLELGADDYVIKPVGSRELLARVRAILRRVQEKKEKNDLKEFGDISIDFKKHEVLKDGQKVHLTALEFRLLKYFVGHQGIVVTRDDLLDGAWGEAIVSPRTIDSHIVQLRRKLEEDPANPQYLKSVRGVGYKFEC